MQWFQISYIMCIRDWPAGLSKHGSNSGTLHNPEYLQLKLYTASQYLFKPNMKKKTSNKPITSQFQPGNSRDSLCSKSFSARSSCSLLRSCFKVSSNSCRWSRGTCCWLVQMSLNLKSHQCHSYSRQLILWLNKTHSKRILEWLWPKSATSWIFFINSAPFSGHIRNNGCSWQRCSKLLDLVWAVNNLSSMSRFSWSFSCDATQAPWQKASSAIPMLGIKCWYRNLLGPRA